MVGLSQLGRASLRPLEVSDVEAATALSSGVGWNQDSNDWLRLITLHPAGAIGAWRAGALVGTATLVTYGERLGWLGMVIVAPRERGHGLGAALIDAALAGSAVASDAVVGLDATDFGAPLYERRGFETVAIIERWSGVVGGLRHEQRSTAAVRRAADVDLPRLVAFDRTASGVDRSTLLARLLQETNTVVVIAEASDEPVAFAALRTGRTRSHLGPLVATDFAAAGAVIAAVADYQGANRVEDETPRPATEVYLDAVQVPERSRWLAEQGFTVDRSLKRMARPAEPVLCSSALVAATGFEWG